jgi:diaminohydroxyphosphoribosylaminopyrimidine deaminase/5-amino-6-(5-phosphoribosylamino)uracil reductase
MVAEGWHDVFGGLHAEAHALQSFDGITDGTVLYVTLEPCAHAGKQPACTAAIIASGISTVVIGMHDPNPAVRGGGADVLRSHGLTVIEDVYANECAWINRFFTTWVMHQRPYVIGKIAATSDGCAIARTHDERWITSQASRARVHALRAEVDCVITGSGTVNADDPLLNVRMIPGRHPVRAVFDTTCAIAVRSAIVRTAGDIPTYILCAPDAAASPRAEVLRVLGCTVLPIEIHDGRLSIDHALSTLQKQGVASVMVEAGPTLLHSFVEGGFVDELELHVGSGTGDTSLRWSMLCTSPNPHVFELHHEAYIDGDLHRVFVKARA